MRTQPHRLAVPRGSQFYSLIKRYLKSYGLQANLNPLFTERHMNYDHGLFESLNAFLTAAMIIDKSQRPAIVKFLHGDVMRDLSNEEYRLNSEDRDRQAALNFLQKLVK